MSTKKKKDSFKSEKEFKKVYKLYWKKLYALCYGKTKNVLASEEMVQDIFISIWKRKDELEITDSLEHYLLKSAKLKVIDYYRKLYTKNKISECSLCEEKGFDEKFIAHNDAISEYLEQELQIIINKLPCKCQEVYRLSREKHLKIHEISERMVISKKTVKNHLTKALSFIKKEFIQ